MSTQEYSHESAIVEGIMAGLTPPNPFGYAVGYNKYNQQFDSDDSNGRYFDHVVIHFGCDEDMVSCMVDDIMSFDVKEIDETYVQNYMDFYLDAILNRLKDSLPEIEAAEGIKIDYQKLKELLTDSIQSINYAEVLDSVLDEVKKVNEVKKSFE